MTGLLTCRWLHDRSRGFPVRAPTITWRPASPWPTAMRKSTSGRTRAPRHPRRFLLGFRRRRRIPTILTSPGCRCELRPAFDRRQFGFGDARPNGSNAAQRIVTILAIDGAVEQDD